jgi:hypothetical protein
MILVDIDMRRIGYSSRRRVLTKCAVFCRKSGRGMERRVELLKCEARRLKRPINRSKPLNITIFSSI